MKKILALLIAINLSAGVLANEVKSNETKQEVNQANGINALPIAVPVASQEKAEKLNAFALYLITENIKPSIVEGEIIKRSVLPNPEESDYPNCRFTVFFKGNSIKFGPPCPQEILLIVDGFENYTILNSNNIVSGDKVECSIIPFDRLSEQYKSTQQADDLNMFLLENYYVNDIHKIDSYTDNPIMPRSGILFSDEEYVSIFERHLNPPISEEIQNLQKQAIQNDYNKMCELLKDYDNSKINEINNAFSKAWNREKQRDPQDFNRVDGFVWRNMNNSFWTLPENFKLLSTPMTLSQKTLDCFVSLKKACESNGVQLIVSLIPYHNDISARVINPTFSSIPDLQTAMYTKQLSEIGIETIYSSDEIVRNYNRYPFAFFFPTNDHPSDTAQDINSDILAERLKRYCLAQDLALNLFSVIQSPHVYREKEDYLFPQQCDIGSNEAGKSYTCREILYDNKTIPRTNNAPIIVVGNSYMRTPMNSPDTLPTLLSMKMLSSIDYYRIESLGPFTSIISQILLNPERFFTNKKALIMHFGTKHLTMANSLSLMVDIQQEDNNRLLLNGKSLVMTYNDFEQETVDDSINNRMLKDLFVHNNIFTIEKDGSTAIASIPVASIFNSSKEIICMIPALCLENQSVSLVVNGIKKRIPTYYLPEDKRTSFAESLCFPYVSFELPSFTKTIEISAEGKRGDCFAIKDITIWQ